MIYDSAEPAEEKSPSIRVPGTDKPESIAIDEYLDELTGGSAARAMTEAEAEAEPIADAGETAGSSEQGDNGGAARKAPGAWLWLFPLSVARSRRTCGDQRCRL
jgi:hypothetical protein